MLETIIALLGSYGWHFAALCVAPLLGFIVGQIYKVSHTPKPSANKIRLVNALSSAVLSTWFWPAGIQEALKIGVITGIGGCVIVWGWFQAAKKWAPDEGASLKGVEDTVTILPWVAVNKSKVAIDPSLVKKPKETPTE